MQKNAMLGGAVTGALVSAVNNHQRDKVVENAITGGAIAAAAELLTVSARRGNWIGLEEEERDWGEASKTRGRRRTD